MRRQSLLSLFLLLIILKVSGNPSGDLRLRLETAFNEFDVYSVSFDSSRSFYLDLIDKSSNSGFWDIAVAATSYLAFISELHKHYDIMANALEKGQLIMKEHEVFLDSIDPGFGLRSNLVIMTGFYYAKNNLIEKAENTFLTLIERLNEADTPDKATIFTVYAYIADMYMDRGLYEKVFNYYVLMEKTIPEGENHDLYSFKHLLYFGTYYYRKKEYDQALSYIKSSVNRIKSGNTNGEWKSSLISYNNLMALNYQGLGRYDSAMLYLKRSLRQQKPDDALISDTYEIYGDCLWGSREFVNALTYYEKVYSVIRTKKAYSAFRKAQILSKISETLYKLGRYSEAAESVQQAFSILYSDPGYSGNILRNPPLSLIQADKVLIRLMITKANSLFELVRKQQRDNVYMKSCLDTYYLTTFVLDDFRHEISTNDFKEFFVNDIRPMFDNAVKATYLAWETSRKDSLIELAFYFMEKSKSQVLLDAIKTDYATELSNIPAKVISTGMQLKNQLVQLQNLIYNLKSGSRDSMELSRAQIRQAETQTVYEKFLRELEKDYPDYYNLKYNTTVPSVKKIKQLMGNSQLIEYMVGNNFIGIVSAGKNKLLFRLIETNGDFTKNLSLLLSCLATGNISDDAFGISGYTDFIRSAHALYKTLLEPVLEQTDAPRRLIIIPDGQLGFLPFDVLIEKEPQNPLQVDYRNLAYLIRNYIVSYEYSSVLLVENFSRRRQRRFKSPYIGFAPVYFQQKGSRNDDLPMRGSSPYLTPLKYNNEEVTKAAGVFRGKAFTGDQASASRFKGASHSARIIHFAGHTLINDSISDLSGLFFSGDSGSYTDKDIIYLNEILNLDLNSGLVILSACESGTGKLLRGEGLISIGRAFRYAGSRSMIMTLWNISDISTSQIIGNFCYYLKQGKSRDFALRKAKLKYLMKDGDLLSAHPYFWASLVMIGENEPLFSRKFIGFLISGTLALFLLIYLIVLQKKK